MSCAEARAAAACLELAALRGANPRTIEDASGSATVVGVDASASVLDAGDACGITQEPLRQLQETIAGRPAHHAAATDASRTGAWPPRYLDRIDTRFSLSVAERSALEANGLVVADRLPVTSYGEALHELSEWQLPIFISADMLLAAVHAGHEALVVSLEQAKLKPAMSALLAAAACSLPAASRGWPAEVARDVELYVTVARALFRTDPSVDGLDEPDDAGDDSTCRARGGGDDIGTETRAIVRALTIGSAATLPAASPSVVLARARALDPSMFRPHGHYATAGLAGYYRAATWVSRLELRLGAGRSCPGVADEESGSPQSGTSPAEALDALALAELIQRSGAASDLDTLDTTWSLFAARRGDVSMANLTRFRGSAGIQSLSDPRAASKLQSALDGSALLGPREATLETCGEASSIATLLAPRVEPPTAATSKRVADAVPERPIVHAADLAYALGNDRAKAYLAGDLARWPALATGLDRAREEAAMAPSGDGLYGAWLDAIRGLAEGPSVAAPSFMRTNAWRDLRLNTTVAALGQIRDDAPLPTAGADNARWFETSDAWLEPVPATIDAVLAYASRGSAAMARIDPDDRTRLGAYFDRLTRVMTVLGKILEHELSGDPLDADERRFLGMIAGYDRPRPGCSGAGCPPMACPGWWFDLFVDRAGAGMSDPRFLADDFVSASGGIAAYVGVGAPRLGVFVVDSNGPARAMVGPVATAYETVGPVDRPGRDRDPTLVDAPSSPWSVSYTVPASRKR